MGAKRKFFTPEEDAVLVARRNAGGSFGEIGAELRRNKRTVQRRWDYIRRVEREAARDSRAIRIEDVSIALINLGDCARAVDIAKALNRNPDSQSVLIKLEEILEGRHFKSHVKCGRKYYSHR